MPPVGAPVSDGGTMAVGQALGAYPIRDAANPAWRAGSFMGDVLAADTQAITLDEASRQRLLERKSLPFGDPPPSDTPPSDSPPTDPAPTGDGPATDPKIPSVNDPDDQEVQ
mgnify:CR=1 FL=1